MGPCDRENDERVPTPTRTGRPWASPFPYCEFAKNSTAGTQGTTYIGKFPAAHLSSTICLGVAFEIQKLGAMPYPSFQLSAPVGPLDAVPSLPQ